MKKLLRVLLGLTLGLVLAEGAFWLRDGGAFPHVNVYAPDGKLGVRLEPNAEQKLSIAAGNPITTVRTNRFGYRAPEWPEPTEGEVVVVGDSQVFGLGVEQHETFSAKLAEKLGKPVLNGGVPTYGPREYTSVVEELLKLRQKKVRTVVYVLNLSNDLFEVDRPNLERHTVWDGWAVRTETAPAEVTEFPLRRQLMSRSHLVFAFRQWLHATARPATDGFATEGSWKDVVQASTNVKPLPPADAKERELLEKRAQLGKQLEDVARELQQHVEAKIDDDPRFAEAVKPLARGGDPRDILYASNAEAARRVDITAYHLFMASLGADKNQALLEKIAAQRNDPELKKLVEARKALRAQLDALVPEGEPAHVLPIEAVLNKTRELCDEHGAQLLVVALPLDVMVSADEWKKYGVPPLDMAPTLALVDDVVARSERLGALALDPTEALRAAEPGAFLQGDLHLTPKGHEALATAIAGALTAKKKITADALVLPEGRSWPPTEDEWRRAPECVVKGSTAAGCETKLIREWLRVSCRETADDDPWSVAMLEGGHGDALIYRREAIVLMLPLLEGDTARARFSWTRHTQELALSWPRGGERVMAFEARKPSRTEGNYLRYLEDPFIDPLADVKCPAGQVRAGALRRCAPPCEADAGCPKGHCESWPTGAFCAEP